MKRNHKELNDILDRVTAGIRNEKVDPSVVRSSAEHVWKQLSDECPPGLQEETALPEQIRNCSDFQTLIPVYLRGNLSGARALLLEDHTHECIPCRKALKQARAGSRALAGANQLNRTRKSSSQHAVWKWGIAAALIITCGLAAVVFMHRFPYGEAIAATVQSATGSLYRVSDADSRVIAAGEQIQKGEKIRTAKGSAAVVRLTDGSLIEMRERSEFSVTENSQGTTIHLDRGNVIVQAAKQRSRHLYVATPDSLISVTGTIFSVNSGTKGSRVSVIEGEVRVSRAGDEQVLRPGDQVATNPSLELVPVKDEIAWSRDADRYVKLVSELTSLSEEINRKVPHPGVRYSTRFLDMLPEGTVLYAALPNISATLSESHRIMQERIEQNAALREWWKENQGSSQHGTGPDRIIERIREFGEYLGDEIVVSAEMNEQGRPDGPLVLGELKNAAGFRSFLEQQIEQFTAESKNGPAIRIIADPLATSTQEGVEKASQEIFIWIRDDFFAASPKLQQLRHLAATLKTPGTNRFVGTSFYTRLAEIYREGAGLIVAADLEKIIPRAIAEKNDSAGGEQRMEAYRQLGILNLKHFVIEEKAREEKMQSRAVLTFNEPRRGIASWLAAPGPMGALEFISPDANVATAFVVKEPVALVDDLLGFIEKVVPDLRRHLREAEAQHGLDVRQDFAAPLGGEFAFAVDGPVLPTPSWKVVFEVYDQSRLQQTFERVVNELNQWATKQGRAGLQWEKVDIGGRTFYALKSLDLGLELHYAYVNGYLVAAPTRAMVDRAVRYRESGYTLLRSPRFKAALPEDGSANFSAIVYHNLAPLVQPLAQRMGNQSKKLSEGGQQALEALAGAPPTLAYAYAQGDRIVLAANGEAGPFGLSPGSLLGLPSSLGLQHILMEAMQEKGPRP